MKHLTPYLTSQLMIKSMYSSQLWEMQGIQDALFINLGHSSTNHSPALIKECKPILRPLSDLLSCGAFAEIETVSEEKMNEYMWDDLKCSLERCEKHNAPLHLERVPYWVFEILFKYHVDVFGLIDKGLAIDINTLNK